LHARSSLGLAYVHAWRWEDAWLMLNEAKKRDPNLALSELGFALYYSCLGDAEGAKRSLASAERLDPLNIELADWGQWALSMVGEVDVAMAWAEKKMRQHPCVGVVYSGTGRNWRLSRQSGARCPAKPSNPQGLDTYRASRASLV
jgi:Tfp pilus assembly protein PilF